MWPRCADRASSLPGPGWPLRYMERRSGRWRGLWAGPGAGCFPGDSGRVPTSDPHEETLAWHHSPCCHAESLREPPGRMWTRVSNGSRVWGLRRSWPAGEVEVQAGGHRDKCRAGMWPMCEGRMAAWAGWAGQAVLLSPLLPLVLLGPPGTPGIMQQHPSPCPCTPPCSCHISDKPQPRVNAPCFMTKLKYRYSSTATTATLQKSRET